MSTCFRCGGLADQRAHVFPRQLFSKPRPTNLPTVPSCCDCNQGFSEDERLLAIIATDYWHPEGRRLWDTRIRPRLQHPKSRGFRISLQKSVSNVSVASRGLRIGNPLYVERERLNGVLANMLRGLTLFHGGGRLPLDAEFEVEFFGDLVGPPPHVTDLVKRLAHYELDVVVDYWWGTAADDPRHAVAAVRFYRRRWFFVAAIPPGAVRRRRLSD